MSAFFQSLILGLQSIQVPFIGFHMSFWDLSLLGFGLFAVTLLIKFIFGRS